MEKSFYLPNQINHGEDAKFINSSSSFRNERDSIYRTRIIEYASIYCINRTVHKTDRNFILFSWIYRQ